MFNNRFRGRSYSSINSSKDNKFNSIFREPFTGSQAPQKILKLRELNQVSKGIHQKLLSTRAQLNRTFSQNLKINIRLNRQQRSKCQQQVDCQILSFDIKSCKERLRFLKQQIEKAVLKTQLQLYQKKILQFMNKRIQNQILKLKSESIALKLNSTQLGLQLENQFKLVNHINKAHNKHQLSLLALNSYKHKNTLAKRIFLSNQLKLQAVNTQESIGHPDSVSLNIYQSANKLTLKDSRLKRVYLAASFYKCLLNSHLDNILLRQENTLKIYHTLSIATKHKDVWDIQQQIQSQESKRLETLTLIDKLNQQYNAVFLHNKTLKENYQKSRQQQWTQPKQQKLLLSSVVERLAKISSLIWKAQEENPKYATAKEPAKLLTDILAWINQNDKHAAKSQNSNSISLISNSQFI